MKNTSKLILIALLAGMVVVSGCNKKNRKAEGADMGDGGVSTSGTGTGFGPDGKPLGDWQSGASADLLSQTRVYFAYDNTELDADSQAIAEAHAAFLSNNPSTRVVLEGHADERGTREYNLALGERRAQSVADVFVALGVNAANIENVSYGEENPVAEGHDESSWRLNRRVEIRYDR
ncbi:MAG: peptidoglycan-associated lipoprotein Pal [Gammaproteobacteria bacterium]|nr:MAG: peptidoglycan-associated lipoprotein Pal [Gammaproteobacteria bacterium]